MDSAINTGRKFPGYTTDELKAAIARIEASDIYKAGSWVERGRIIGLQQEIDARERGESRTLAEILGRA